MLQRANLAQVKRLMDGGAQVVEVLPPDEYADEHLPGAINIPLKELNTKSAGQLDPRRPVVVYCYDQLCDMSPRAAWRLQTLGFQQVHDYVAGKVDWLAHGLPREGASVAVAYAGDVVDPKPPTCALINTVGDARAVLGGARYGFCLVVNEHRIVLGRLRLSGLETIDPSASVESVMEPGPSTVRPNIPAADLIERLAKADLRTAIVTTPSGCLIGVFSRGDAQTRLDHAGEA